MGKEGSLEGPGGQGGHRGGHGGSKEMPTRCQGVRGGL